MKKALGIFVIFMFFISTLLAPLSAFAEESLDKPNEFGVVPYNENMVIKTRDVYSNDFSNSEFIKERQSLGGAWAQYDGKFNPKLNLGGVLCNDAKDYNSSYNKEIINLACDSWVNQKNNILTYHRDRSFTYYSSFKFLFYTGSKNIKLEYFADLRNVYNDFHQGFFADLQPEDYKDFYEVSGYIYPDNCSRYMEKGHCSVESIDIELSFSKFSPEQYTFNSPYENKRFIFGNDSGDIITPVFSNFDIIYPEKYPEQDKVAQLESKNDKPVKEVYHPYFWFSVKDKNMKGMIQSFFDSGKNVGVDGATGRIKPFFELYDEKREKKIFEYSGTTLKDNFKYDFEEYNTYYVKTYVQWDFPAMLAPSARPEIIQPVWTKVVINGSDYAVMTNVQNPKNCDSNNVCNVPDYVESCSLITADNLALRVGCEFKNLDNALRKQLGFLFLPVDIFNYVVNNFQTKTQVQCSPQIGAMKIDACIIERKLNPLYVFLVMASNGVLLFALVLFLRSSLIGFLNSKGDD